MTSDSDITWRNILLLCGGTIAVTCATTFFVMRSIYDGFSETQDLRLNGLQRQIDQVNDRMNAMHRDMEDLEGK